MLPYYDFGIFGFATLGGDIYYIDTMVEAMRADLYLFLPRIGSLG